jgi:DNA polymerase III sliding clamp (beta) subunit (PCNA family)
MREALNFVKGAVARKDFVPELTHFSIEAGRITGYNGDMALSSPIAVDIMAKPHAQTFIKAINACEGETALSLTKAGKLSIKSGKFRALVQCLPADHATTFIFPEGQIVDLGEKFLDCIKALAPFQGIDASRPWATGIMLKSGSALATNNICLVEYWHGVKLPFPINIPRSAINELIRINLHPKKVQVTQNSISFHFDDGRWLRTQLLATNWPEVVEKVFSVEGSPQEIPVGLFDALDTLKPFVDDAARVFFTDKGVATSFEPEEATTVDVPGLTAGACFNHAMLSLLSGTAEKIDFSTYPKPCKFVGKMIRGVIIGLRY